MFKIVSALEYRPEMVEKVALEMHRCSSLSNKGLKRLECEKRVSKIIAALE